MLPSSGRCFGWLNFTLVLGYCAAAWWPFSFQPHNNVSWLPDRSGVKFAPEGIAFDMESLPLPQPVAGQPAGFTAELWVEAEREPNNNVFHLLTIHDDQLPSSFVLCQWKRGILLRVPGRHLRARGVKEVGADDALPAQQIRFITVTGSGSGVDFYLDGKPAGHFPEFVVDAEAFSGRLILGNAANGKHGWTGRMFGLALYGRAFDAVTVAKHHSIWVGGQAQQLADEPSLLALYDFRDSSGQTVRDLSPHNRHLTIPAKYQVPHKEFLNLPRRERTAERPQYRDVILNILGFMPFGFCYLLHRRFTARNLLRHDAAFVVLTGAIVSLLLETVQVWLSNRVSSAADLICNTTGTLLGLLVACAMMRLSKQLVNATPDV